MKRRKRPKASGWRKLQPKPVPESLQGPMERLREVTHGATSFADAARLFHDELAELPAFVSSSTPARSPTLDAIVDRALERAGLGGASGPRSLLRVGDLLHGAVQVPSGLGVVYWFEDDGLGLLTAWSGGCTHYLRLTAVEVERGGVPSPGGDA